MSCIKSLLFLGVAIGLALSQNPWDPVPKNEDWWMERHREILNTTASRAHEIKIVFVGSSSVEYWGTTAKDLWDSKYAPLGAVNYGIRADRTQHVLWRIENGEFDGLNPKLVVIYIGSNNAPVNTVNDTVRGVNAVVDKLHEKLPDTNLLFVGFFPRGDRNPVRDMLTKIRNISDIASELINGDDERNSYFLDFFWELAPRNMSNIYEEYYRDDLLHMNRDGYTVWDEMMNSTFYNLIK